MKIQYEKGDWVYRDGDYGGVSMRVTEVKKNGVICESEWDRRNGVAQYLGFRHIEPHPRSMEKATIIRPKPQLRIPELMTCEMIRVYEEYHDLPYNPANDHLHYRAKHFWCKFKELLKKEKV